MLWYIHSGPEKNCTEFNAPSFCNHLQQNHTVFTKMLRKDHCLLVNAKFVCISWLNFLWQTERSDTCHERRHPACEYDTSDSWTSTANKDFANWKDWNNCWKWLLSFQRDGGNGICCLISYEYLSLLASLKGWMVAIDLVFQIAYNLISPL